MGEKLRIYLDTNIIYGYFKRRVEEKLGIREYKEPESIKFLRISKDLIKSFISFFTLLEITENLIKMYDIKFNEIIKLFRFFRSMYPIKILDQVKINEETLKWYFSGMELNDTIQLSIAKNKDLWFISGDKKCIESAKTFYERSLTFQELKHLLSSSSF